MNAPAMARTVRRSAPQTQNSRRRGLFVSDGSCTYGRLGFDPLVVFRRWKDLEKPAHAVMAVAAKLRALDLICVGESRNEMNRHAQARRGILRHAQRDDFERVNHVQ